VAIKVQTKNISIKNTYKIISLLLGRELQAIRQKGIISAVKTSKTTDKVSTPSDKFIPHSGKIGHFERN